MCPIDIQGHDFKQLRVAHLRQVPRKPVLDMEMPTSVSNSILCHVSISRWCAASGHKAFDDKRNERCCRLTADVARKTIEILNANFIGKYRADAALSEGDKACHSCPFGRTEMSIVKVQSSNFETKATAEIEVKVNKE